MTFVFVYLTSVFFAGLDSGNIVGDVFYYDEPEEVLEWSVVHTLIARLLTKDRNNP